MFVKSIMQKKLVTVTPDMTFFEAAGLLLKNHVSGAPVLDKRGKLVGILSEKDLFRALYPSYKKFYLYPSEYENTKGVEETLSDAKHKKVSTIMSTRIISATPETPVLKIGGLMVATGIHRVPVLEGGKVIGMVSRGDIYRAILQKDFNLYDGK